MIIEKIDLLNFKAYRTAQLRFSTARNKNVTLVYGENGAGKSSIFQAILWCLYGRKNGNKMIIPREINIPGKYLKDELKNGEEGVVRVAITFQHKGERFTLTRELTVRKSGSTIICDDEEFTTLDSTSRSGESKQYDKELIQRKIDSILPSTVREYFFFDGEKIEKYMELNNCGEIQSSIKAVLGLEDFENAKKYLNRAKSHFDEQIVAAENEDYQTFKGMSAKLENENQVYETNIRQFEQEKADAELEYQAKEKLCRENKEQIELRIKKRDAETELLTCEQQIKKLNEEYLALLSKPSLALACDIQIEIQKQLKKWSDDGVFPAENYNKDLIEKTLKHCSCLICGTKFKHGDKVYKHVEKLEQGVLFSREVEKELNALNGNIKLYLDRGKTIYRDIRDKLTQVMDEKTRYDKIQAKYESLKEQIDESVRDEDLRQLENERDYLKIEVIPDYKHKIANLKEKIEANIKEIGKYERAAATIDLQSEKDRVNQAKADLCNDAKEAINYLLDVYAEKKRQQINTMCADLFKSIVWKDSQFRVVELTKEYELNVYDRFGEPARPDLSAGERQVLSLSFITAMAQASGSESPFIIDTPFGRISKRPRNTIAENIPGKVSQLILFVTDTELTEMSEKLFKERSDKIWTIMFDQKTGIASFKEGKHVDQDS